MTEERRTIPMVTAIHGDEITVERVYEDEIEWIKPKNAISQENVSHDEGRDEQNGD